MQPDQAPFLCPTLFGPSGPLVSNKLISLEVPTLLYKMALPPNHFEIPSSPPPLLPSLVHLPPLGTYPSEDRTIALSLPCQDPPTTWDTSQDLVIC